MPTGKNVTVFAFLGGGCKVSRDFETLAREVGVNLSTIFT